MYLFNFKNLINKYSKGEVIAIVKTEGHYDMDNGGKWIEGETLEVDLDPAAILPMNKDDLKFDNGGTYSYDNRKLYCYVTLEKGTLINNIQSNGTVKAYKILSEKDYSDFDENLHIYILERANRNDKQIT